MPGKPVGDKPRPTCRPRSRLPAAVDAAGEDLAVGLDYWVPTVVSLPFKLLLFVLVDGWSLLMSSLAASFT